MLLANELSLFAMVVEANSFNKAATLADMSTSALSKRITKLEADIGVQLLYRTTRRITLTEAGGKLYLHAKDINKQVSEALGEVSDYSINLSGHIRMTIPTISGELFLADCIAEFGQRYPEISIEVRLENAFVDLVKEGVDLAIRTGVLDDSTLIAKPLITSHWVVCCSPKYIKNHGSPLEPSELIQHNCLAYTYQNQGGYEWRFNQGKSQQQVKISVSFATNNAQALRKAALGGYGIVYIPRCSVYEDLQKGDLIELLPNFQARTLGVYAVYPFTKHLPNKVKLLIEHIKQGYESLSHYF
jgi:DNA-binding transcriptional LysR family regulator